MFNSHELFHNFFLFIFSLAYYAIIWVITVSQRFANPLQMNYRMYIEFDY